MLATQSADEPVNLAPLLAGSEGSLAIITQLKLRLIPRPEAVNLIILYF